MVPTCRMYGTAMPSRRATVRAASAGGGRNSSPMPHPTTRIRPSGTPLTRSRRSRRTWWEGTHTRSAWRMLCTTARQNGRLRRSGMWQSGKEKKVMSCTVSTCRVRPRQSGMMNAGEWTTSSASAVATAGSSACWKARRNGRGRGQTGTKRKFGPKLRPDRGGGREQRVLEGEAERRGAEADRHQAEIRSQAVAEPRPIAHVHEQDVAIGAVEPTQMADQVQKGMGG